MFSILFPSALTREVAKLCHANGISQAGTARALRAARNCPRNTCPSYAGTVCAGVGLRIGSRTSKEVQAHAQYMDSEVWAGRN